jgi:hypothetical protein
MRRAEHIPVHRGAGRGALTSAVAALEDGELVLVLPEQTISPSLELLPFKPGAWRLPVTVRYGEPLHPGPDDDPEVVTHELRRRVGMLLDEVQRSYPDGTPQGAWWVPARLGGGAPGAEEADAFLRALAARWRHPTTTAPVATTGPGSVDGTVGELEVVAGDASSEPVTTADEEQREAAS